jgi:RNA polymerase sigma-70 factor (ECF subfamily)
VPTRPGSSEDNLLERLRSGNEEAFAELVDGLHPRLVAFAGTFTSSPALAEDIVQETWLAVIRGLGRFEGRSTLRTWIYSILVRRARSLASRESRRATVERPSEPSVNGEPAREWSPGLGRYGLWEDAPVPWGMEDPATLLETREALAVVEAALESLPPRQRQVVLLRDVEDLGPAELCNILDISETNQRVLLHRGRARIRKALDEFIRHGTRVGAERSSAAHAKAPAGDRSPGVRQRAPAGRRNL